MQNIELVVFDMAGTVFNENYIVYKTLQKAINNNGYLLTLDYILEHGAGKEKHQAIKDILAENDSLDVIEESKEIFKNFKRKLEEAYLNIEITAYEGINNLIKALKEVNIKIALNTGYEKNTAHLLLNKMNWKLGVDYDLLITSDDIKRGRPYPDMVFETMDILNIEDSSKVLKVGDSVTDILEGKNAHCGVTIGVTTGAHTKEQLKAAKPTYIFDSILELKKILVNSSYQISY